MVNKLVFENLKHRPIRTFLSVCAIAISVTMVLTLVGLCQGMLADSARRANGVGADIWIKPPGSSLLGFSQASMSEKLVDFFQHQPHVAIATGQVLQAVNPLDSISGIDYDAFNRMSGGFVFLSGTPFKNPDDILVDQRYAEQKHLRVGSTLNVTNKEWRVCGIVETGKLAHVFLPIRVLQERMGVPGKISQIFIKLDDPANLDQTMEQFKSNPQLAGYNIQSLRELTSLLSTENIPYLNPFINVVIGISVIVGFLVVFLSMYTAVLERTREIGILKSLGASRLFILGLLVRETAMLALTGAACGILATFVTQWLVRQYGGVWFNQIIVYDWWPRAAAIALAGSLLGTLYPGWKAVQQDALEALAYE